MRIDYQHVDIAIDEQVILMDVNFQAGDGEFIYLIGKVGTGKSSLLKSFYGELDVHTGNANVLGFEMTEIERNEIPDLRKKIGMDFQNFQLLTDRNVHDNLDFVLRATGWNNKIEREQRIREVLEEVGLPEKGKKMPYELSGGEQQCICIARAILNKPAIILADEATGNLDKENSRKATSLLYQFSQAGATVIMSTHNEELLTEFPGIVYKCTDGFLKLEKNNKENIMPEDIESESIDENITDNH